MHTINQQFDVLIIGTGSAGLMCALQLDSDLNIALISKDQALQGCSYYAQGGISAVLSEPDNFDAHVQDTLSVGAGLGDEKAVRFMVEHGPEAIHALEENGVVFTQDQNGYHLTTEGGHSHRRVAHVADKTGQVIQGSLYAQVEAKDNITVFENHIAVDLLHQGGQCFGAYVLDTQNNEVLTLVAHKTIIATGGASKVYLYTSNPDTSTGDGIAMAHRLGAKIVNMEFTQFHPTCLYHPYAKSFLISEALRGEGAKLTLPSGEAFMHQHDERGELAPRDVVARAIDFEIKKSGFDCVYLDISFKAADWIKSHFPQIYEQCLSFGIDITRDKIPVVPAAHYTCGGIHTDLDGQTNVANLYAIGEAAHTGVHGANRLASNSLLECLVFAKSCADHINRAQLEDTLPTFKAWDASRVEPSKEMVMVSHLWDELRRIMWNFVGIVRSNKRLELAQHRINQIQSEVNAYYGAYLISADLLELRNLATAAALMIESASSRHESRGLHYNKDYPQTSDTIEDTIL